MGPGEFVDRLDELVEEAEKDGLHIAHIENNLQAKLEDVQARGDN